MTTDSCHTRPWTRRVGQRAAWNSPCECRSIPHAQWSRRKSPRVRSSSCCSCPPHQSRAFAPFLWRFPPHASAYTCHSCCRRPSWPTSAFHTPPLTSGAAYAGSCVQTHSAAWASLNTRSRTTPHPLHARQSRRLVRHRNRLFSMH